MIWSTVHWRFLFSFQPFLNQYPSVHPLSMLQNLELAVRAQAEVQNQRTRITFLTSSFPLNPTKVQILFFLLFIFHNTKMQMIKEILESLIPLRPPKLSSPPSLLLLLSYRGLYILVAFQFLKLMFSSHLHGWWQCLSDCLILYLIVYLGCKQLDIILTVELAFYDPLLSSLSHWSTGECG